MSRGQGSWVALEHHERKVMAGMLTASCQEGALARYSGTTAVKDYSEIRDEEDRYCFLCG